jgi:hypothetical protein
MDTRNEWRNQLISEHAEVARRIALKMARRCPDWVAREDLVAAGMLGRCARQLRVNEARSRLNFRAGSASLFVAEWMRLPHGQG